MSPDSVIVVVGNELRAITSAPPPDPAHWAFSPENDLLFSSRVESDPRITPDEWVKNGYAKMQRTLSMI